jgi:hypothetical protein
MPREGDSKVPPMPKKSAGGPPQPKQDNLGEINAKLDQILLLLQQAMSQDQNENSGAMM